MVPTWELILRIAVGGLLGGAIGFERDIHGRPVGFRTHMIVALAAATFMVVSTHFVYYQHYRDGDLVEVDSSRIAASVVTGIGFLAGGAIFRAGATVQGLTTAAAFWLVTAIGLCAGGGMYVVAVSVTVMGLLALAVLRLFEGRHAQGYRRSIWLELSGDVTSVRRVAERLAQGGVVISHYDYAKTAAEKKSQVTFEARVRSPAALEELIRTIEQEPDVLQVKVAVPK